jgi:hypothetical protein
MDRTPNSSKKKKRIKSNSQIKTTKHNLNNKNQN